MNSANLARTTFVLARETHEQLDFISRRMGVSRSELVRDVLAEPVALMAKWVRSVPDDLSQLEPGPLGEVMQLDMVEFIQKKADEVRASGCP